MRRRLAAFGLADFCTTVHHNQTTVPLLPPSLASSALSPTVLTPRVVTPTASTLLAADPGDGAGLILDWRAQMGWRRRLPARLGTSALWGLVMVLLLPGLAWAAAGAGLALPLVLRLLSQRPRAEQSPHPLLLSPAQPMVASQDPQRQQLADAFGLDEASLFRARHAQVCTVHHDDQGEIVAFSLPAQVGSARPESSPQESSLQERSLHQSSPNGASSFADHHAHSVG